MLENVAKVLVLGTTPEEVGNILAGARVLGREVVLMALDAEVPGAGADRLLAIDRAGRSAAQIAPSIVSEVLAEQPDIVLAESGPDGRLLAAFVAAALGESALTDATNLRLTDGRLCADRMVYGGKGMKTESSPLPAVACVARGEYQLAEVALCAQSEARQVSDAGGIQTISVEPGTVSTVDLDSANIVVGVGRGVQDAGLGLVESFASALSAEIACTRPLAEESQLLPRERYVGISGQVIKPKVYIACGISGQAQHLVGVEKAGTIIAVNKDKSAPVFKHCDIGVVGDVSAVLPAIAAAL